MKSTFWIPLLAALLFSCFACEDKAKEDSAQAPAEKEEASKEEPKAPLAEAGQDENKVKVEQVAPPKATANDTPIDAAAFFKDCQGQDAVQALAKYSAGITISGPFMRSSTGINGDHQILLAVDETSYPTGNWITLAFADNGEAAKAKAPQAGDLLTAKCELSTLSPKNIKLQACVLQ